MQHRPLGHTGIDVSVLCLGTMTFGEQNTEAEAHAQLDRALAAGIDFIDTAEMYPVPPRAETQGMTESYIGSWLAARGRRDRVVLATKVAGRGEWINWLRGGGHRLDRRNIESALDASLRRLSTDYVDLYQLHWPDRETNFFGKLGFSPALEDDSVPLLETLEVLGDLVKSGKVRAVGVSNETPWGLMRYLSLAERHGLPRMASIQNPYSLLNRSFEIGLAEVAIREQCGLLPIRPLASGCSPENTLGGNGPWGRASPSTSASAGTPTRSPSGPRPDTLILLAATGWTRPRWRSPGSPAGPSPPPTSSAPPPWSNWRRTWRAWIWASPTRSSRRSRPSTSGSRIRLPEDKAGAQGPRAPPGD